MASVGTAYVSIRVDTKGFEKSLDTALARMTAKAEAAGASIGKSMTKGLKSVDYNSGFDGLRTAGDKAATDVVKSLDKVDTRMNVLGRNTDRVTQNMTHHFDTVSDAISDTRDAAGDLSKELTGAGRASKRIDFGGGAGGSSALRQAGDNAGFFRSKLQELAGHAAASRALMHGLFTTAAFGGTALGALAGGASAAVQGLVAITANAAAMIPALSAATTGIIGLAQVAATLGLSMAGVGNAIGAGLKSVTAVNPATTAAATGTKKLGVEMQKMVKPAKVSRDAILSAKEAAKEAARGIVEAKDDLKRAYRDVGWSAADASQRTQDAEADLADAQGDTLEAQEALNAARAEAIEQLEDIAFKAEDAALGEERAGLKLEDAYAKLLEVSQLAPDDKARREAELAYKEAELGLRTARDAREDADAEAAAAAETGIEGTEAMMSAREDLASAKENEAQATADLADAQNEEARNTIENAEKIVDAQNSVIDARNRYRQALGDVAEAEADYGAAVKAANAAAAEANANAREANARAREAAAAAAAQVPALTAVQKAQDAYQQALKDLSPAQQEFVRRIVGMREGFIEFRKELAEPIFQSLNSGLDKVVNGGLLAVLKDGLRGTSRALADIIDNNRGAKDSFDSFGELADNPIFQKSFGDVLASNNESTRHFGRAGVYLADAFVQVADAASPLLEKFSKWVEQVTLGWSETSRLKNTLKETDDKFTPLEKTFKRASDRVQEFWGLGVEMWKTLRKIGEAANEASNQWDGINNKGTQGFIPNMTEQLEQFREGLKHKDLVEGFNTALDNLTEAGKAVNKWIIVPFTNLGQDENFGKAFTRLSEDDVSTNMKKISDSAGTAAPKLAEIAADVLDIVAAMSESKAIEHFLDIMGQISDTLADIVGWAADNDVLKFTGYLTGALAAWKLLKSGLTIAFSPFAALAEGIMGVGDNVRGMVDKQPGEGGRFRAAWSDTFDSVKRAASNTIDSMKNVGTRIANIFRPKDEKVALRQKIPAPDVTPPTADPGDKKKAHKSGEDLTEEFAKGLRAGMVKVEAAMEAVEAKVRSNFTEMTPKLATKAHKVGNDIMEGLEKGITTGKVEAIARATDAGHDVAKAVGKGAGTMSPSWITIKDGNDVMEGLELGIESGTAEAKLAATRAGSTVGHSVGNSAKVAAVTSTAGIGSAMGDSATSSMGKSTGKMSGAMGKMMKPLTGVAKGMGSLMTFAMGPFGIALELIFLLLPLIWPLLVKLEEKTGIFSKTLKVLTDALKWVWDKIKDLFGWVMDNWPLLLTILTGPFGLAVSQIIKHWDDIKAAVDSAVQFVKGLLGNIWDGITAGWDKIVAFFNGLWANWIQPAFQFYIDMAKAILSKIWDGITGAWDKITTFFGGLWTDKIEPILTNIINKAKAILEKIWDAITGAWGAVSTWLGNLWSDKVQPKISSLVSSVGRGLANIWDGIMSAFSTVGKWIDKLWDDIIQPKVSALVTSVGKGVANIWDGIISSFGAVKTWIQNLWSDTLEPLIVSGENSLVNRFSRGIAKIWSGLQSGFVTVYNGAVDLVNNYLIKGINAILDLVNVDHIGGLSKIEGKAEGGPIRGPGGPKADKVLIRASNGEYMLPAAAARKLGPRRLEYLRKHGELPRGGSDGTGGLFGSIRDKFSDLKDAIASGAESAFKYLLSGVKDKLGGRGIVSTIIIGALDWAGEKFAGFGAKKDEAIAAAAAAAGPGVPYTGPATGWTYPLAGHYGITQGANAGHNPANAIDFGAGDGVLVVAASGGKVYHHIASGGLGSSYGRYIVMSHANGLSTLYAHLSAYIGASGRTVRPGEAIGRVGHTGNVRSSTGGTGAHLHFEINPSSDTEAMLRRLGVKFARGGVVAPSARGTMAVLAEAGRSERVTPLDREGFTPSERKMIQLLETRLGAGGGGDTYQIHPSAPVDEVGLADLVARRVSWNRRRGAGAR